MDVFDEVERRELNTSINSIKLSLFINFEFLVWHAQVEKALIPLHVVPFLPVNPSFSATRNQVNRFFRFLNNINKTLI